MEHYKQIMEEFDKKFVRDDGLMDKYHNEWDIENIQTTAEAIKSFLRQTTLSFHRGEKNRLEKELSGEAGLEEEAYDSAIADSIAYHQEEIKELESINK